MDDLTRRRLEIEGYSELGMWQEVDDLRDELIALVPDRPEALAFLVMSGVALQFGGERKVSRFYSPTLNYILSDWGKAEISSL